MSRSRYLLVFLFTITACKKAVPPDTVVSASTSAATPREDISELVENFERVHFALDKATLDSSAQGYLRRNAQLLAKKPDLKVEVQGHADERGTTDYNLALGAQRAKAVQNYLVEMGVARDRITVLSLGEERPLDPSHSEVAWAENRRAEFRITWGASSRVAGTIP